MTSNAIVERDPLPVETGVATAKGIPSHRGEPYGPRVLRLRRSARPDVALTETWKE